MRFRLKKTVQISSITAMMLILSACGAEQSSNQTTFSTQNQETGRVQTQTAVQAQTQNNVSDETGTYPDGTAPQYSGIRVRLTVDGEEVVIAMYDNTAADAFLQRLPLENISFYDLSGIEKPAKTPDEAFSIAEEKPGYDPVTGEMVIYRPWGNFTIFYGDFRHSDELVPLGKVESGLEILAEKTADFTGTMKRIEE